MLPLRQRRPGTVADDALSPLVAAGGAATVAVALWYRHASPHEALLLTLLGGGVLALVVLALYGLGPVAVLVFCSMTFPQSLISPGGTHIAICDLLLVFTLGAWLAWIAVRRRPLPWLRGNPYVAPALVFAAFTFASVVWSRTWTLTVKQGVQIFEIVVVFPVMFASLPRTLDQVRRLLVAYVMCAAVLSGVVFFFFLKHAAAGDVSPEYLPGMHKNATGGFLGVACVFAYGLWLEGRPGSSRVIWLLPLELAGLFGTVSRGAMVGTAVAIVLMTLLIRRRRIFTGLLVAAATSIFLVTIQWKLPTGGYSSFSVRPQSWAGGVRWIEAHPFLGTGAGTYYDYLPKENIGLTDPNNLFLLTWAELGIFGLLALVYLLYRVARLTVVVSSQPGPASVLGAALAGAAFSNLVHFQFDTTWARGTATMTFASIGLLLAVVRLAPQTAAATAEAVSDGAAALPARDPLPVRTRSLRVLQVVASPEFGAVEEHVVRLARGLRERRVDCRIACPLTAQRLREAAARAAVPVTPAAGRGPWLGHVLELVAASAPEVVHVHDDGSAVAGWQLAEAGGSVLVRTQHAVPAPSTQRRGRMLARLQRSAGRSPDVLIAVSGPVARWLSGRESGRVPVRMMASGVELPADERVARGRLRRAGLGHPAAAFVGTLEPGRGLDLLLLALARVRRRVPDFRLVVAGAGPAETELRRRAAELGVADAVEWPGPVRSPADAFRSAQAVVVPGGLGTEEARLVAEAMAWGLPVVAPWPGGGLVADGETGLLFDEGDVRGLADALVALASDPDRAERLGAAARQAARERLGVDSAVVAVVDAYEAALRSRRR